MLNDVKAVLAQILHDGYVHIVVDREANAPKMGQLRA
jgi:hypothetical protein